MKFITMLALEAALSETASPNVLLFNRPLPKFSDDDFYVNPQDGDAIESLEQRLVTTNGKIKAIQSRANGQNRKTTEAENLDLNTLFDEFESIEAEIDRREKAAAIDAKLSKSRGRQSSPGSPAPTGGTERSNVPASGEAFIDRATGQRVAVLSHDQRFANASENRSGLSVGDWLSAVLVGGKHGHDIRAELGTTPDADGGYAVPTFLANEFIDKLRAAMVLSRAGAKSIQMPGKTLQLAKIEADPAVAWHQENQNISATQPTLSAVVLSAKTVVVTTKFSVELAQDSANISQILQRSLVQSLATAIDRAGLVGDGSSNSPTGVLHFADRNVVSVAGGLTSYDKFIDGVGALMNSNVPLEQVGPIIIGPHAWKDLAKIKTGISSDKTTLAKPPALTMPFLVTTAAETSSGSPLAYASTGFVGDWSDLFFGIRKDITVRILDQAYFGSNLTLAVTAYARVDFAGAREESFATLEGITH